MKPGFYMITLLVLLMGNTMGQQSLTQFVNPFIGTQGGAHTFPGAVVPFGMIQVSPDAGNSSYEDFIKYRNGHQYDFNQKEIQGFGHLHLSGTASDPAGDISVLPMSGLTPSAAFIKTEFSHAEEWASPGYYGVILKRFGIKAELAATLRCGFHRYSFPGIEPAMIRFDLGYHNGAPPVSCEFKKLNDSTFVGSRFSTGYADDKRVFFAVRTNTPITDIILFADTTRVKSKQFVRAVGVKSCLIFPPGSEVLMKVALSFADVEGALEGLKEIPHWSFERVKRDAQSLWERELKKIEVFSKDTAFLQQFYTAAYHCYVAISRFDDARGFYRGADGGNHKNKNIYSQFGLWDTYRALHPLFTLAQPERVPDFIRSFLQFYDQYGLLPVWEMAFCETHCMTGYHAVPVVADAILKGFGGFNYEKAYEAILSSANQDIRNTKEYRQYHYVPFEAAAASVTKTAEYAFDDWSIAQVALKLGKLEDYRNFMRRSNYWKNLFDPSVGFLRPKYANGNWVPLFNSFSDHTNGKETYTEGNAWHYTFMVPQDVPSLTAAFESGPNLIAKLDSFFSTPYPKDNGFSNMGGIIGQYAHGNQPSHHIPYFYTCLGHPWKTAELVKKIMYGFYSNQADGITGNEDTGSMSSWYLWSAMGLFPFNPVGGNYIIASPMADKTIINLAGGKRFIIQAKNLNKENIYVQQALLNGKPYAKSFLQHRDIIKGGELVLEMGNKPSDKWGKKMDSLPINTTNN